MKVLDFYLMKIIFKNLIISFFGMIVLFFIQFLGVDWHTHAFTLKQVFFYNFLNIPMIFVQIAAPVVLTATVFTLSGLSRTQELIACYAIGVGLRRILLLFLFVLLLLSGTIFFLEDCVLPRVFHVRNNYLQKEVKHRINFVLNNRKDKVWYRSKNMIYNLGSFDPVSGKIYKMVIYKFNDHFELLEILAGNEADYSKERGWRLYDGVSTVFNQESEFPNLKKFYQKEIVISEVPEDFKEIGKEVDGLNFKELRTYLKTMKESGLDTKAYEVKYHSRMSLGFAPMVMCFLAIPFSIATQRQEGRWAINLGLCFVITFFYWLFYSVGLSLGMNGALQPWLAAWFPSLFFLGLGLVFTWIKK